MCAGMNTHRQTDTYTHSLNAHTQTHTFEQGLVQIFLFRGGVGGWPVKWPAHPLWLVKVLGE